MGFSKGFRYTPYGQAFPHFLRNPVEDPESEPVISQWRVLQYAGAHHLTAHSDWSDSDDKSYGSMVGIDLQHGKKYVVEINTTNQAGLSTTFFSLPITVDETGPTCIPPTTSPVSKDITDNIVRPYDPNGGNGWYRSLTWIGPKISGLKVDVVRDVCTDPESGFRSLEIGVCYRPSTPSWGQPEIVPYSRVAPPGTHVISFAEFFEKRKMANETEELEPGLMHYLVSRCRNGGYLATFCPAAEMMVDGSLPVCFTFLIRLLGEGYMHWTQAETGRLTMEFPAGMYDPHTGLAHVEYALEVSEPGLKRPGPPRGKAKEYMKEYMTREGVQEDRFEVLNINRSLAHIDHQGKPPSQLTVYSLDLQHNHWYRVLARATNGVGLVAEWCPTPWVLIDTTPPTMGVVIVARNTDDAFLADPPVPTHQWRTRWIYLTLRGFEDPESGAHSLP